MASQATDPATRMVVPSVESARVTRTLPFLLSMIAGATDVIGFLGLGIFTAQVTGNLVFLAAHAVTGSAAPVARMMAVPVFMLVVGLTRLLAAACEAIGLAPLRPLLLLHLSLLVCFLALGVSAGSHLEADSAVATVAAMLGVSAMAVQNALIRIGLTGAPATSVMTTNVTLLTLDLTSILLARKPDDVVKARDRARHTWPVVAGFVIGCGLGTWCEVAIGFWSLALPAGLALLALMLELTHRNER
jgi:uncharacterized membrane protein YoaK (UPF0700 family)